MADHIEVGNDLFIVINKIMIIAQSYNDALQMYDEGMKSFLDGGNGYLGKTKENLEQFNNGLNGQLVSLVNYLQITASYVYSILQKFAEEDEKLAQVLKMIAEERK
ncbi:MULTISPECIES: hypothetical protein [Clostridium]|uniref:LXG domain-containing protein n=1 Tax=Clostridium cibarium TaxID=2762247 RepID=A0ABR8PQV3_9CLOT|nr:MULTISPECIES: hypothetical protein [Clostridium]MBD7910559.1 hypothetical protein [Clostridium cibarium]